MRIFGIFTNFDFTDAEDYLPLLSLVVGLLGVGSIYCLFENHKNKGKVSAAFMSPLLLPGLWPLLPNFGLFFMARELQARVGYRPQVMVDDPRGWYGHLSPRFDDLSHLIAYLEAFSGAWMVTYIALLGVVQSHFSVKQRRLCLGFLGFSILLFMLDPGNLYAWWLD